MTTSSSKPDADQLTFWSEAPPVSPSASLASEKEWTTTVVTSPSSFAELLMRSSPVGSFGKTCQGFYPPAKDETLVPSSGRWLKSGMISPGESLTLNTLEYHNAADECSLSDILVNDAVPQRYYLSAKASQGILRRAEKRGKALPPSLKSALEQAAQKAAQE